VEQVVRSLGATLEAPSNADELVLLDSEVMNHALRQFVLRRGAAAAMGRVLLQ
jgi:hypothetical protein